MGHWRTWMMLGGRGAGKTRAGAEWITALVYNDRYVLGDTGGRIALVGETFHDVRSIMIEGESGLLSVQNKNKRPKWHVSKRQLEWPNGTIGQAYSASDPDGLRGSQFGAAWCDEAAKWPHLETTWSMLQFCLRLGKMPRQLVTTTPRPLGLIKKLVKDSKTRITRARTQVNRANLAPGFMEYIEEEYGGTRLGRQEIDAEILEDRKDALWQRSLLEQLRERRPPELMRIVVAVDPPASSGVKSDACGIMVVGKDHEGICHVLEDATAFGLVPEQWAKRVTNVYGKWGADCVIAEVNQGGEMVNAVLSIADPNLPIHPVRARRGKWLRAEPVALLYSKGRVRHLGAFPELEDQMCDFGPDGLSDGRSPDRLDALVWAIHALILNNRSEPKIRAA